MSEDLELRAAIERVRDLHQKSKMLAAKNYIELQNAQETQTYECEGCDYSWPCPTIQTLNGEAK